ncbi:hypothetical protein GCM10023205_77020 [Yinghuangia aomiensis]|uniref:Uncharacterized protein n=1 Tax=Yinghuangia aomiensis TaxID=676205 RepID=A0ABP9IB08_9ACTN
MNDTTKDETAGAGGPGAFVTLFSLPFDGSGFLEAEVAPDGEQVTIRTQRWPLAPLAPDDGPWVSGSVAYTHMAPRDVDLVLHDAATAQPWCTFGAAAPLRVAHDLGVFLAHARARAARPLRDLEEALRRARYAVWAAERGPAANPRDADTARDRAAAAEDALTGCGGNPDLAWPHRGHDDGTLL